MSSVRRYVDGKLVTEQRLTLETTADLRNVLLDQIAGVVEGKVSVEKAKAISILAEQVYKTAKLEIEFAATKKHARPLRLVNDDD